MNLKENRLSKLSVWEHSYPLKYDECPCDVHFVEWLRDKNINNKTIFHFGTGEHHYVGENCSGNSVMGITASVAEYQSYIETSIKQPEFCKSYKVFFGDIYQLDRKLLPDFDIITMFHLCEYSSPVCGYEVFTDLELLQMMTEKVKVGGNILFYTGSYGFRQNPSTREVLNDWIKLYPNVKKIEDYKSLIVFQKIN